MIADKSMAKLFKRISIKPNQIGYLYRKNQFSQRLSPGIYRFFDWNAELETISLPTTTKLLSVLNQEVLTNDNIALRFSYLVEYKISDGQRFLESFDVFQNSNYPLYEAEQLIHNLTQVHLRQVIAAIDSEAVNEQRHDILATVPIALSNRLATNGIEIQQLILRDITFPKMIQDLFAKQLEAKIRAKADLENARTTVATARALKNASELMKDDENIKFFQLLETITKIASNGKHTFVIGDLSSTVPTRNGAVKSE